MDEMAMRTPEERERNDDRQAIRELSRNIYRKYNPSKDRLNYLERKGPPKSWFSSTPLKKYEEEIARLTAEVKKYEKEEKEIEEKYYKDKEERKKVRDEKEREKRKEREEKEREKREREEERDREEAERHFGPKRYGGSRKKSKGLKKRSTRRK